MKVRAKPQTGGERCLHEDSAENEGCLQLAISLVEDEVVDSDPNYRDECL